MREETIFTPLAQELKLTTAIPRTCKSTACCGSHGNLPGLRRWEVVFGFCSRDVSNAMQGLIGDLPDPEHTFLITTPKLKCLLWRLQTLLMFTRCH